VSKEPCNHSTEQLTFCVKMNLTVLKLQNRNLIGAKKRAISKQRTTRVKNLTPQNHNGIEAKKREREREKERKREKERERKRGG